MKTAIAVISRHRIGPNVVAKREWGLDYSYYYIIADHELVIAGKSYPLIPEDFYYYSTRKYGLYMVDKFCEAWA